MLKPAVVRSGLDWQQRREDWQRIRAILPLMIVLSMFPFAESTGCIVKLALLLQLLINNWR